MQIVYQGVQLAQQWAGWVEGVQVVLVEPKIDGYRLSAVVESDLSVSFRCRDPEPPLWIEHLDHVRREIEDLGLAPGSMLDGEVMAENWNETSKLLRTYRAGMDDDDRARICREVKFHVFDWVDLLGLETRAPVGRQRKPRIVDPRPQLVRTKAVVELLEHVTPRSALQWLAGELCHSVEQVDAAYARFCQAYEGVIVKLPEAPYYFLRSDAWLKIKPTVTEEITITGVVAGEGKHTGRLGALVGQRGETTIRVGTGFSDAERERLWAYRHHLPGMRVEISYQGGAVATARHPVFHRVRDLG
jgi:ATP-dependent DNA ligase